MFPYHLFLYVYVCDSVIFCKQLHLTDSDQMKFIWLAYIQFIATLMINQSQINQLLKATDWQHKIVIIMIKIVQQYNG